MLNTSKDLEQCSFARSIRTNKAHPLLGVKGKRQPIEQVVRGIRLAQVMYRKYRPHQRILPSYVKGLPPINGAYFLLSYAITDDFAFLLSESEDYR